MRQRIAKSSMRAKAEAVSARKDRVKRSDLEKAQNVLRRHGKTVCDAGVVDARFKGKGLCYVDTRKVTHKEVLDMAREIEVKERARNSELRKQHGLDEPEEG
jgi:hypothetical protein